MFALTVWVLIAGTLVTAAGPHGGDASAKRLSWPIPDAARLHGGSVDTLLVLIVVLAWRLQRDRAPRRALTVVSIYLLIACAQAALGYIQYFDAIPVLLVGFHVAGRGTRVLRRAAAATRADRSRRSRVGRDARGFRPVVAPFRYDRTFDFDVERDVLWDALTDTGRYPTWWPWLRKFDAPSLAPGTVAHCAVRGPLPYTLDFSVHMHAVGAGRFVDAEVRGDLSGPARLIVEADGPGCATARLTWDVELRVPMLSVASRFARPLLVWAHDQVVASGVDGFRRNALDGRAPT